MPSGSIVICNEYDIDGLTWVLVVFLCRYVKSQVQGMWREHELDEAYRNVHACVG